MDIIEAYATKPHLGAGLDVGPNHLVISTALKTTPAVASGDLVRLHTFQKAGRISLALLATSASLGAGCTVKLTVGTDAAQVDVTGATTAAAASKVNSLTNGAIDFKAGDSLFLTVAGAAIGAAATAKVDVNFSFA